MNWNQYSAALFSQSAAAATAGLSAVGRSGRVLSNPHSYISSILSSEQLSEQHKEMSYQHAASYLPLISMMRGFSPAMMCAADYSSSSRELITQTTADRPRFEVMGSGGAVPGSAPRVVPGGVELFHHHSYHRPSLTGTSIDQEKHVMSSSNIRGGVGTSAALGSAAGSTVRHTCQVCGDSASGVHYGVQTCEGCKSFYKRSLQGKGQTFRCAADNKCQVDKKFRRNCAACRLRVCQQVGMRSSGVRKRKQEAAEQDTITSPKMVKLETVDQLELRESSSSHINIAAPQISNQSTAAAVPAAEPAAAHRSANYQHVLPLSPMSLPSPSPTPEPDYQQRKSEHQKSDERVFTSISLEEFEQIEDGIQSGTPLCTLFHSEITNVIQWAKTSSDYRCLPTDDQVYLMQSKCLELLIMSVVSRSYLQSTINIRSTLNFTLTPNQFNDLKQQSADHTRAQCYGDAMLSEKLFKLVCKQLKNLARDTFCGALRAVKHFISLKPSQTELEFIRLLIFTNTDTHMDSNLARPDLVHRIRDSVISDLLVYCQSADTRQQSADTRHQSADTRHQSADTRQQSADTRQQNTPTKRFNDLIMSLSSVRDVATRLEYTMLQQTELLQVSSSLIATI